MRNDAALFAGLMPHAPILVPSVGRRECARARSTIDAMTLLACRVVGSRPDALVVISPHSPRRAGAFGIWKTPRLRGSLAAFGSTEEVDLPLDAALAERIGTEADRHGVRTWWIADTALDHGAVVPLVFLETAGWRGPTVIVGPGTDDVPQFDEFGEAIAAAAASLGRRVAVIASGDMSHRLLPTSPCGFSPEGARFDRRFVEVLQGGDPDALQQIDPLLAESAGEDVVESTWIAMAATGYDNRGRMVLSYEGPFGVGYGVAVLFVARAVGSAPANPFASSAALPLALWADLPLVARAAVAARLAGGAGWPGFEARGALLQCRGVFVTVRTDDGELRGCQGAPLPTTENLLEQTWRCALNAAFSDPRFVSVTREELPRLRFTVSVLGALEPVASWEELDPARYGIVVSGRDGQRGLLLPGIPDITTVADQVWYAKRKAGLSDDAPVAIERFTTDMFEEPLAAEPSHGTAPAASTPVARGAAGIIRARERGEP